MNPELFQPRPDLEQNLQGLQIVGILDGVFIVLCTKAVERGRGIVSGNKIRKAACNWGRGQVRPERGRGNGYTRARNRQHPYNVSSFYL